MVKWAVYKNEVGLYACEYIDTLEGCKGIPGWRQITEDRLPILLNRAGGHCSFDPEDSNFVKIIEVEDDKEPLTREQCFPMNSDQFRYGWISPDGDTYNTGYTGHYRAAEMICDEVYPGERCWNPEQKLEDSGWIKISRPGLMDADRGGTRIFTQELRMTKKQADKLIDLGYSTDEKFRFLVEVNEENWQPV